MSKKLVAFFSASGTTKKVAQMIAEEVKADLFEIEPKVPYTKLDLDWMNKKSRSSVEMSDKKYRPEIMKKKMDMSSYDEILLGFPIWWYVAPTIINTFLEAYDFSGKKIVLFATSGGSGFGNTVKLPTSATSIMVQQNFEVQNSGTVYGSYQHATGYISLAQSKKYSIHYNGAGTVFLFDNSVNDYFDQMGGVYISM